MEIGEVKIAANKVFPSACGSVGVVVYGSLFNFITVDNFRPRRVSLFGGLCRSEQGCRASLWVDNTEYRPFLGRFDK